MEVKGRKGTPWLGNDGLAIFFFNAERNVWYYMGKIKSK